MKFLKRLSPFFVLLLLLLVPPLVDYRFTGGFGPLTYTCESIGALAVFALIIRGIANQAKDK
ncbi:hypothetical protein AUC43_15360 [Hymenobacter sedentarius]|uniref:Uncharacterized protein n=1 Tax=Hymenobacter sedentarius TaxID=1411621 RepID=A0A0U4ARX3_9BACT|nr:hypothetical protein [Hymenobacter sedentarius]ALW86341.1 hypothetical protein AUC43_15360 [Hymenobacter sedentarius]